MKSFFCVVIFALAFMALGSDMQVSLKSSLTFDTEAAKNRPVTKVITLLKDMLKQLEKEADEDETLYDQMACWCETYDKEKTKAVEDSEVRIEDLTAKIEELTALSAQLNTEIKNLEQEVAKNQNALDQATALRKKQLAEFNAEEKDMLGAITSLKQAVTVLSKHNSASMLQIPRDQLMMMAATLQYQAEKYASLLKGVFTHAQNEALSSFVQSPQDYFDAKPTFKQAYAPQSGEIFGILSQMKETFQTNLASAQKEEATSLKAYEELKAAKEEEIAAGQSQIDAKTTELADTDEKNAQSQEDLSDTKKTLAADEEFLAMLKDKCSMTDAEWEERQKTRQLEMEAVSKALSVLSGDEAHELFTKTFNPALIETESKTHSSRRTRASKVLAAVARKLHSPRLSQLAFSLAKGGVFQKVKKAVDDMIANLLKENEDEIKHKDFCVDEFNTHMRDNEKKEREKADVTAKIEDLAMTIKTLTDAIDTLKSNILEMQTQLKRDGQDREKQNDEFQQTIADQQATQQLLGKALGVLEGFYGKAAALVQAGQAPPPGFSAYKKNAASGGVMGMMQQIIDDAKTMESEAIHAEENAQKAYEDFVKETNASIEAATKDMTNKIEEKAKTEKDKVQAEKDKEDVMLELEQLSNYKRELHSSCDFVMKNFEMRQSGRAEEIEALKEAKALISGANYGL